MKYFFKENMNKSVGLFFVLSCVNGNIRLSWRSVMSQAPVIWTRWGARMEWIVFGVLMLLLGCLCVWGFDVVVGLFVCFAFFSPPSISWVVANSWTDLPDAY